MYYLSLTEGTEAQSFFSRFPDPGGIGCRIPQGREGKSAKTAMPLPRDMLTRGRP